VPGSELQASDIRVSNASAERSALDLLDLDDAIEGPEAVLTAVALTTLELADDDLVALLASTDALEDDLAPSTKGSPIFG
jgi:hypothetical protein